MKHLPASLTILFTICGCLAYSQDNLSPAIRAKLDELKQSAENFHASGNRAEEARQANQVAYIYWENKVHAQAAEWFNRSLAINKTLGNQNAVKNIYSNLGFIYADMNDYPKALQYFGESLKLNRAQRRRENIASDLQNIAQIKSELRQYADAIKDLEEAASLAIEDNNLKLMQSCFLQLAENYEKVGDPKKATEYFNRSSAILAQFQRKQLESVQLLKKDAEMVAEVSARQLRSTLDTLAEIKESFREVQLRNELMAAESELKDLAIKEEQAQNRANRYLLMFILGAFVLVLLIMLLVFIQFAQKKRANKLLKEQNQEIERQRDLADRQKQKVTDSIAYARRIQQAILPPEELLGEMMKDYFVLFMPRDIVSGDFYWFNRKENILVIAAADCTGHGVPGAFMSMLGIAFLSEIVNKKVVNRHINSLQANEILNELRDQVILSLHQTGSREDSKDGMDIALCIIDFEERVMQFASAHNPLFLVRNGELYQYSGDKMPVGHHKNMGSPFTLQKIDLKTSDTIYLFSDGLVDQFGGPDNTKFLSKNFKELILRIHAKPMKEQREVIRQTFEDWRGSLEQIDDILVIGFRYEGKKVVKPHTNRFYWPEKRILIAEDTDINYFLLVEALKDTKAQVTRATNGREAVEHCRSTTFDLVLMDINMPVMNGYESTRMIKDEYPHLPIIVQTALNLADEEDKSIAAGADDYISKPVDLKSFLITLEKYLN